MVNQIFNREIEAYQS